MRNIFLNRKSSKLGLLGSLVAVVAVAFVLALVPQKTNIKTLAENCVNPPTTPTLNYWPITYDDVNTPLCHDFPAIDAAVYNPSGSPVYSQSDADWNNGLNLTTGQEGVALMYIHNGAANNLPVAQVQAKNVKITTSTDTSTGGTHNIAVRFAGDNTNTVNKSFAVHTPTDAHLEIVPNSGFMYDYTGKLVLDQQNLNLGNSTYTLGNLDACFEYSVFLTFRFKVVGPSNPVNPTLSITKQVRSLDSNSSFTSSQTVNQNERVQYKVVVSNTSATTANNVTMTDNSVYGVAVDSGSTTVDGSYSNQGQIPGTINLGSMSPGSSHTILYNARVTASSGTYTNTATAVATSTPSVSATANVYVRTIVNGNPNLTISKLVKNDTTGTSYTKSVQASSGNRVHYSVTITNTGNADVYNARITDPIPAGLQFDDSVSTTGTPSFNIPNLTVDFGTIPAGQSRTVEFAALVNSTSNTQICNVANGTGSNVGSVNDSACVNLTTIYNGNPNIIQSKTAWNNTKNVDATTVTADRGNTITFTLNTTNTGNADSTNYVITDDLSGVLPLADIVDNAGSTLNGNTLTYPAMTIHPGQTVTKTFKVYVKTSLAPALSYQIRNTYGNTVVINIPGQTLVAPKTGTASTSAVAFAGLLTLAAVAVRRGKDIMGFIFA